MNRPEARNAQNLQMTYDLNAAFDQAGAGPTRSKVINSSPAPARIFRPATICGPAVKNNAGVDFPPVGNWGRLWPNQRPWPFRPLAGDLSPDHAAAGAFLAKPTIAEVHGKVHRGWIDAGRGLWTFIVASADAEFCDPVVTMGRLRWSNGSFIPGNSARAKAKELLFTADAWEARTRPHRLGMVNHVVPRRSTTFFLRDGAGPGRSRPSPPSR